MTFQLRFTVRAPTPSVGLFGVLSTVAAVGAFGLAGLRLVGGRSSVDPVGILYAATCDAMERLGSLMAREALRAWRDAIPVRTGNMRDSAISGYSTSCNVAGSVVTAVATVWFDLEGDQRAAWFGLLRYRPDLADWPVRWLGAELTGTRGSGNVQVDWVSGLSGR